MREATALRTTALVGPMSLKKENAGPTLSFSRLCLHVSRFVRPFMLWGSLGFELFLLFLSLSVPCIFFSERDPALVRFHFFHTLESKQNFDSRQGIAVTKSPVDVL
jgi:hypothetical protein